MAAVQEYKLKDISSLSDVKPFDKIESEVEGVEGGKVLVLRFNGQVHVMSPKCTHYGAPLKLGVVTPDGRITCPWHGACFSIDSGDVEDAPAPNALNKFEVIEKNDGVYIRGEEKAIRFGQRDPVLKCSVSDPHKVVVVGGGSGTLGLIQAIRELNFRGSVTVISKEPNLIIDRTKLSKALITNVDQLLWRPKDWYESASIDTVFDEVTSVDFDQRSVSTKSGKTFPYTKLVLATGGIPLTIPVEGLKELGKIFLLRAIPDAQNIVKALGQGQRKKVVIIGSSFIGMEVGNKLGSDHDVTIVGMESAPMERVMGAEVGRIFQRNLEKAGIKFKLSTSVAKVTPSESDPSNVGAVHLKDGSVLPADLVILGTGIRPATDFLKDKISLEKDGSVRTDEYFAVPGLNNDVFAIGDIATYPYHGPGAEPGKGTPVRIEHWNVAQNAGRGVARTIVHSLSSKPSQPLKYKAFVPIFWSALGAQLRYCGNPSNGWDKLVLKGEPENAKFSAFYCKGDTVVAVATMGMDPLMAKSAELMRRGNMPTRSQIESGIDLLTVDVPGSVKI